MAFTNWLRSNARTALDSLFCSTSPDVQLIGHPDSGWYIKTGLPLTTVYCAGVGLGISFETELAKQASRPLLLLDPSPTGIDTVAKSLLDNIEFFPVGIAAQSKVHAFSVPRDPGEGSYSVPQDGLPLVRFECWDLNTIMRRYAVRSVDLLKMDIEGFEYDILDRLLDERVPVRQICVEFHPWLAKGRMRTFRTVARLYAAGYRIIHKRRGDYTFLLSEAAFRRQADESSLRGAPAFTEFEPSRTLK